MHFLFLQTKNAQHELPFVIQKMGHRVSYLPNHCFDPNDTNAGTEIGVVKEFLDSEPTVDIVITYQFHPLISDLCEATKKYYFSWIYDSPQSALFHKSAFNRYNRIFVFDNEEVRRLKKLGDINVYYLPLAANTERTNRIELTAEDEKKYTCDISFVGNFYDQNLYNRLEDRLPADILEKIAAYVEKNMCDWRVKRPWFEFSESDCNELMKLYPVKMIQGSLFPVSAYYSYELVSLHLGELERKLCLEALAGDFEVDVYTKWKDPGIPGIKVHPEAPYYTELGKVYAFSKINLAFTLPSIETGIPLRIWDILSYGGFALTNYQEDLDGIFEDGKELAVYRDLQELTELCGYYLTHEKERLTIALNGYKKLNELHDMSRRVEAMIETIEKAGA